MGDWRKPEGNEAGEQAKQQQGRRNVSGRESESAVKPVLFCQDEKAVKTCERSEGGDCEHFWNVLFLKVPDFMSQHSFEFGLGKLLNQGIKENDFSELAEAREEGVGVAGTFAAVHDLNTASAEPGLLGEFQETGAQGTFG